MSAEIDSATEPTWFERRKWWQKAIIYTIGGVVLLCCMVVAIYLGQLPGLGNEG